MAVTRKNQTNLGKEDLQQEGYASTIMGNNGEYSSYQEMVNAKRKRNMEMLKKTGLLEASAQLSATASVKKSKTNTSRGIKRNAKKDAPVIVEKRRSSRIAGVKAAPVYVEHEAGGRITIGGGEKIDGKSETIIKEKKEFYRGRVNDGVDLSVREAVELSGWKWVKENSVDDALNFARTNFSNITEDTVTSSPVSVDFETKKQKSKSSGSLSSQISKLSIDHELDGEENSLYSPVAKVVPDRIYAMTCHPSEDRLIACAGDKQGHVGLWHIDHNKSGNKDDSDEIHLFKPHGGAVSNLEWNSSGTSLFSTSYDGTIREFDCNKEVFKQVFAVYDDSDAHKGKLGYGLDEGYGFWLQYGCLDPRNENCMFLSTSRGGVIHLDLRAGNTKGSNEGGSITFNKYLSEKKINTLSLHPNGHTLATGGLDNSVKLWDIRSMGNGSSKPKHFAVQNYSKSVNSVFFSPSGKNLVSLTMTNHINITSNAHICKNAFQPSNRISHFNQTGRWLTTFNARWHPTSHEELFVVGSMRQPRRIEIFDANSADLLGEIQGDGLTAVASRCCFHPSENQLIVVGGNSSGRVTVAQSR